MKTTTTTSSRPGLGVRRAAGSWVPALLWLAACGPSDAVGDSAGGTGGGLPDVPCTQGERLDEDDRACYCVDPDTWVCVDGSNPDGIDVVIRPLLRRFDFLLVVDDGPGMLAAQGRLAASMDALVSALDAQDMDYDVRLMPASGAAPQGTCEAVVADTVAPRMGSCRGRLDAFVSDPWAPATPASACTDVCALDTLTQVDELGTTEAFKGLSSRGGTLNLVETTDAAAALRCMVPQGNAGCDVVQPLAVLAAPMATATNFVPGGFTVPSAGVGVIVLTDGLECSLQDASIFDPAGDRAFWSDPQAAAATPAVCWNAGVSCDGGPGTYTSCAPADYAADGSMAASGAGVLTSVAAGVQDALMEIRGGTQELLVIAGVPEGYPQQEVPYGDATDPDEAAAYGVLPGCETSDTRAQPPVRLLEAADAWSERHPATVASVCAAGHGASIEAMVGRMEAHRTVCLGPRPDMDPQTPGLQPLCFFEAVLKGRQAPAGSDGEGVCRGGPPCAESARGGWEYPSDPDDVRRGIPLCAESAGGGWEFPSDQDDLCVRLFVDEDVPAHCESDPAEPFVAYRVERRRGASYNWADGVLVWCADPAAE